MPGNVLNRLPTVGELLENPALKRVVDRISRHSVVQRVRGVLDDLRREAQVAATEYVIPTVSELAERIARRIYEEDHPGPRVAINATGMLLHPELGPPPLAEAAIEDMVIAGREYFAGESASPLEAAHRTAERLVCERTGAKAALVFANPVAALLATLAGLSAAREVLIARGQSIVVAPGIDLATIVTTSGARYRDVGATNQVLLSDYQSALGEATGLILSLAPSDFATSGERRAVPLAELAAIARERQVPLVHALGLGGIADLSRWGCGQPTAAASLSAGADLVLIEGDKLLGGPSCGILAGRAELVRRVALHPLARAMAAEKATLAALSATLRLYRQVDEAEREIPLLRMLATSADNLKQRAERLSPQLAACAAVRDAEAVPEWTYLRAEGVASQRLATWCVALLPAEGDSAQLAQALRRATPAVIARVQGERVLLDLRSVMPRQDIALVSAVAGLAGEGTPREPVEV